MSKLQDGEHNVEWIFHFWTQLTKKFELEPNKQRENEFKNFRNTTQLVVELIQILDKFTPLQIDPLALEILDWMLLLLFRSNLRLLSSAGINYQINSSNVHQLFPMFLFTIINNSHWSISLYIVNWYFLFFKIIENFSKMIIYI